MSKTDKHDMIDRQYTFEEVTVMRRDLETIEWVKDAKRDTETHLRTLLDAGVDPASVHETAEKIRAERRERSAIYKAVKAERERQNKVWVEETSAKMTREHNLDRAWWRGFRYAMLIITSGVMFAGLATAAWQTPAPHSCAEWHDRAAACDRLGVK